MTIDIYIYHLYLFLDYSTYANAVVYLFVLRIFSSFNLFYFLRISYIILWPYHFVAPDSSQILPQLPTHPTWKFLIFLPFCSMFAWLQGKLTAWNGVKNFGEFIHLHWLALNITIDMLFWGPQTVLFPLANFSCLKKYWIWT